MKKKVLTVDDSRTIRNMLLVTLNNAGFDIVQAEDGVEGLEVLEESNPDVIVTDINMPRLDGFGFIEGVRQNDRYRAIPILVLTTESDCTSSDGSTSSATARRPLSGEGTRVPLMVTLFRSGAMPRTLTKRPSP